MAPIQALEASTIGVLAHRILERGAAASVLACFDRSFCLDVGGELVTIGNHSLHDGPLNARLTTRHVGDFTAELDIEPGQSWTVSPHGLGRGDGLTIDLSKAAVWKPETPSLGADRRLARAGLGKLRRHLLARGQPKEGMIGLVLETVPPRSAMERKAAPLIHALKAGLPCWLANVSADPTPAIQLLGLGPGLTPSGDDLDAGMLIAWRHLGAASAADRLGRALLAAAGERTTPISQAHLRAAAQGYGAAPLHDLLDALLTDEPPGFDQALDAAAKIGHSSGLDAIAGILLALSAWLNAGCQAGDAA